jgi:hypothetical protein
MTHLWNDRSWLQVLAGAVAYAAAVGAVMVATLALS